MTSSGFLLYSLRTLKRVMGAMPFTVTQPGPEYCHNDLAYHTLTSATCARSQDALTSLSLPLSIPLGRKPTLDDIRRPGSADRCSTS